MVNGGTVEYTAGHQPLVPDFTATSLTGTPIKMTSYRLITTLRALCFPASAKVS